MARILVMIAALLSGACAAERDLSSSRFACGFGGPCDDPDGGGRRDGGGGGGDGGDAGMVDAPACDPAFADHDPCGGELGGEYRFTGACSSVYAMDGFFSGCNAVPRGQTFQVDGTLDIDGSTIEGLCSMAHQERAWVPNLCATPLGGCSGVSNTFTVPGFSTMTCVVEGQGCDCTFQTNGVCISSGTYEKTSPSFTIEMRDEYLYCTGPSSLVYVPVEEDQFGRRIVFVTEKVR